MQSVTEVIDYSCPPQLANWYKNNSKKKCEETGAETARIGQAVDSLIQQDIKEGGYLTPEDDQGVLNCLAGWEKLKKVHPGFVPSVKDMQCEIKAFGVIGHPDFVCEEATGWGITDLKCTNSIRDKNWIQIATYARIIMVMQGKGYPSFLRVIRLVRETGEFEWLEVRDLKIIKKMMVMFDGFLEVYQSGKVIAEFFRNQLEDQLLGDF